MISRIKAGHHRARPLTLGLHWNKKLFRCWIKFDESCKYIDLEGDINKLFGFGYLNGGHHKDSARFGWRYGGHDQIEIFAYSYVDGQRKYNFLTLVRIGLFSLFEIKIEGSVYKYKVLKSEHAEPFNHKKKLQYPLGFYFGGNATAPHSMQITKE